MPHIHAPTVLLSWTSGEVRYEGPLHIAEAVNSELTEKFGCSPVLGPRGSPVPPSPAELVPAPPLPKPEPLPQAEFPIALPTEFIHLRDVPNVCSTDHVEPTVSAVRTDNGLTASHVSEDAAPSPTRPPLAAARHAPAGLAEVPTTDSRPISPVGSAPCGSCEKESVKSDALPHRRQMVEWRGRTGSAGGPRPTLKALKKAIEQQGCDLLSAAYTGARAEGVEYAFSDQARKAWLQEEANEAAQAPLEPLILNVPRRSQPTGLQWVPSKWKKGMLSPRIRGSQCRGHVVRGDNYYEGSEN